FAQEPRYQGGGSSHVNPTRLDIPLDEIRKLAGDHPVSYAPGTDVAAAVTAAESAEAAIVFLGLTAEDESEGYDREHIDLPTEQLELLRAVIQVQPRTVVVLSHGGVVRLHDVAGLAPAMVDGALLGQAGGGALADVLFGVVNPSGRLAETVPLRLQDCPAYLNFPSESGRTLYGERMFVGYRWYDARDLPVAFPFGHGVSYTRFEYSDLVVSAADAALSVRLTVANTGTRSGREVVQVYAGMPGSKVGRPVRWLAGFASVTVEPGQRCTVEIPIDRTDLAYWSTDAERWVVEGGEYVVSVGASSRDIRLTATVTLTGDEPLLPFTGESTLGELLADPVAAETILSVLGSASPFGAADSALGSNILRMLESVPIGRMVGFSAGKVSREQLDDLLANINAQRS
ncbi:beta-glucosidase, partial [Mycolicibacterium fortuitum subsp. fortuitum DSM 46621 = ATCC 6841 = JCM 6387]